MVFSVLHLIPKVHSFGLFLTVKLGHISWISLKVLQWHLFVKCVDCLLRVLILVADSH